MVHNTNPNAPDEYGVSPLDLVEGLLADAQGTHCSHGSPAWQAAEMLREAIKEGRVQIVARVP